MMKGGRGQTNKLHDINNLGGAHLYICYAIHTDVHIPTLSAYQYEYVCVL